jgi:hypothetical protein
MQVFLASREDRESVGHEIVVLVPLKSFRDELRAKVVPLHAPKNFAKDRVHQKTEQEIDRPNRGGPIEKRGTG